MRLLMIIKLLVRVAVLLGGILVLSACRTAETVSYVHEPSEDFFRDRDYEAGRLNEFKDGGILFLVDVNQYGHEQYIAWLALYSDKRQSATIHEARISGGDWHKNNQIGEEITIESDAPDSGLMRDSVRLFTVEDDLLNRVASEGSDITLEVIYSISGEKKIMTFSLKRRVAKYTVFRT